MGMLTLKPRAGWNHSTPPTLSRPMTAISWPLFPPQFLGNSTYASEIGLQLEVTNITHPFKHTHKDLLEEDKRKFTPSWKTLPAVKFVLLDYYIQVDSSIFISLHCTSQDKAKGKWESCDSAPASLSCCWYAALSKTNMSASCHDSFYYLQ